MTDYWSIITSVAIAQGGFPGDATLPVWHMYLATGDVAFYNIVVGFRDQRIRQTGKAADFVATLVAGS